MTTFAAAIVYLCATGWCINVLGTIEAESADECAKRIVPVMISGFPACFVPMNNQEAVLLPRFSLEINAAGSLPSRVIIQSVH